jgi:hypothetical protein
MAEEQRQQSAPFSPEPSDAETGLLWWKGWTRNPMFATFFEPNPEIGVDGEIREVRITKSRKEGSYTLQVGFTSKEKE